MKKIISAVSTGLVLLPVLALAQGTNTFGTNRINNILTGFKSLVNTALIVLSGVAVLVFIYGIIRYVLSANDAEKRKEARGYMIYGVVAFAIIAGLYGLSNALLDFFGIGSGGSLTIPQINTNG